MKTGIFKIVISFSLIIAMLFSSISVAFAEDSLNSIVLSKGITIAVNPNLDDYTSTEGSFKSKFSDEISHLKQSDLQTGLNIYDHYFDDDGVERWIVESDPTYTPELSDEIKEDIKKQLESKELNNIRESYELNTEKKITDNNGNKRTMKALAIGTYCTVWGCTGDSKNIIITSDIAKAIAAEFDSNYSSMIAGFGSWYDADKDGKLAIFCYDIDNDYKNDTAEYYTAGFFRMSDLASSDGKTNGLYTGYGTSGMNCDCIHIDTYPGMAISHNRPLDDYTYCYSTLVHEFQHLISYSYQVSGKTYYDSMETYLDEAFSMAAEHMINGSSSTSHRISWFNSSDEYEPGISLTVWSGELSNYANSYLFGQYLRTRYEQLNPGHGNELFKTVLVQRNSNKGGNSLSLIAGILGTSPEELVYSFWAAVYLKDASGIYGFNGETWANLISPVFSTGNSGSEIYNGGCKYYTFANALTLSEYTNLRFISISDSGEVNVSGVPILGDLKITRNSETSAKVTFTSNKSGTMFYKLSTDPITDYDSIISFINIIKGSNTIDLDVGADEIGFYYYVEDGSGTRSDIFGVELKAYSYSVSFSPNKASRGMVNVLCKGSEIKSGDKVLTGDTISIEATPNDGFYISGYFLNDFEITETTFKVTEACDIVVDFTPVDASPALSFASGDGSEQNPYIITNASEWKYFANTVNGGNAMTGKYVSLGCDLDIEGQTVQPVGSNSKNSFAGVFDGCGYEIIGVSQFYTGTVGGLFGYNSGTVKNLAVTGYVELQSGSDTTNGYCGLIVGYNSGLLDNCYAKESSYTYIWEFSGIYSGGLCGFNTGTIQDSYSSTYVIAISTSVKTNAAYLGGIAGSNQGSILSCYSNSEILPEISPVTSPSAKICIGGIAGLSGCETDSSKAIINNCRRNGYLVYTSDYYQTIYVGEIVGYQDNGLINHCYALDTLSPDDCSIYAASNADVYVGGITGYQNAGTIKNSIVYLKWICTWTYYGSASTGLVCGNSKGDVSNCYINSGIYASTLTDTDGYEIYDPEALINQNFLTEYADFDFVNTWEIGKCPDDYTYPTLKSMRKQLGNHIVYDIKGNGSVINPVEYYYTGEDITLDILADDDYYLYSIDVNGDSVQPTMSEINNPKTGKTELHYYYDIDKTGVVRVSIEFKQAIAKGICGDNTFWVLHTNGQLELLGSGACETSSWGDYKNSVTAVTLSDDIDSICNNAFSGCSNLKEVRIGDGVNLGSGAFSGCSSLEYIILSGDFSFGSNVFNNCSSLKNVYYINRNDLTFTDSTYFNNANKIHIYAYADYKIESDGSLKARFIEDEFVKSYPVLAIFDSNNRFKETITIDPSMISSDGIFSYKPSGYNLSGCTIKFFFTQRNTSSDVKTYNPNASTFNELKYLNIEY